MHDINILIVAESLDIAQEMSSVIDTEANNYFIATSESEAISLYDSCSPKVLIFYHNTVDASQTIYFKMVKGSKESNKNKHESILLCDQANVKQAYEKCKQKLFFDYVVINPDYDRRHVNIVIDKVIASFSEHESNSQVRKFAKATSNLSKLNAELNGVVDKRSVVNDLTAKSLNDLTKKMQSDVNGLSERIKKRAQSSENTSDLVSAVEEEVESFSKSNIADEVNQTQIIIDQIVNRWGAELKQVQVKHSPSLDNLSKMSKATKKMVLIVEDNEVYGDMINKIVAGTGKFEARVEGSVHHGLTSMVCDRPDIVFLDFELPDAKATEFLNKVSQIDSIKNIPVVMLTSHSSRDVVNTVLTQGAVDFVVKPASKKIIVEKLFKWIQ